VRWWGKRHEGGGGNFTSLLRRIRRRRRRWYGERESEEVLLLSSGARGGSILYLRERSARINRMALPGPLVLTLLLLPFSNTARVGRTNKLDFRPVKVQGTCWRVGRWSSDKCAAVRRRSAFADRSVSLCDTVVGSFRFRTSRQSNRRQGRQKQVRERVCVWCRGWQPNHGPERKTKRNRVLVSSTVANIRCVRV